MRAPYRLAFLALAAACAAMAAPAAARPVGPSSCAGLVAQGTGALHVIAAEEVAAGALPKAEGGPAPAFCRVKGAITPERDSRIGFELWLPAAHWNGKFEMVGNGGYSSQIAYGQMAELLRAGYAVAATDTGHQGDDPDFARGHPRRILDWAQRAVHLTAVDGKRLVRARYGAAPRHSYFAGCSTGGHQAMMEAQRFPADFDGIIAGASGGDRTHLNAGFLWQYLSNHTPGADAEPILPAAKLNLVTRAVLAACGADNGAAAGGARGDAWLDDPRRCAWRPQALQCKAGDADDCLTAPQVAALERMYAGAHDRSGRLVAHGWPKGSEASGGPPARPGWSLYWADPQDPRQPARANFWRVWTGFGDEWDWWRFDFGKDMAATDARLAATINAVDPNLDGFRARGGKLIAYHGLADPVVPFLDSTDYNDAVVRRLASRGDPAARQHVAQFYRLFLAPGMGHCRGGPGLNTVAAQAALESWVERGRAPDALTAFHVETDGAAPTFTRPLCAYPNRTVATGAGGWACRR